MPKSSNVNERKQASLKNNNKNYVRIQSKSISPKLIRRQTFNFNNAYNNDNYFCYQYNNDTSPDNAVFVVKKPYVGVKPETRSRKTPNLNIIRSTRMSTLPFEHVVVMDKYNNRLVLPVAKF